MFKAYSVNCLNVHHVWSYINELAGERLQSLPSMLFAAPDKVYCLLVPQQQHSCLGAALALRPCKQP